MRFGSIFYIDRYFYLLTLALCEAVLRTTSYFELFKITFEARLHRAQNSMCGYQDLNLGPRHYQCRALTN